jgi:anti-sigma B factor antagonist
VALDLSEVSFVDSSGLGTVIGALKHVTETGGRFAVIAPADSALMRLLSLTGLDQVLPSLASREGLEVAS